jgi:hypothetical protein
MAYSFSQLESSWIQSGGSKALAPTMAGIALAESGGRPDAHNGNGSTGDDSYGLWQINYYNGLRASRTAKYGPPESMYDPMANARAAIDLAGPNGSGLSNWTTYTSGAYRDGMTGAAPSPADIAPTKPQTDWPMPGHWASKTGKSIGDPPVAYKSGSGKYPNTPPIPLKAPANLTQTDWDSIYTWVSAYFDGKPVLYKPPSHGATNLMLWNLYVQSVEQNKGDIGAAIPQNIPGVDSVTGALKAIGQSFSIIAKFFEALIWIFNVNHFIKFMLYVFGSVFVLTGLFMVIYGPSKDKG